MDTDALEMVNLEDPSLYINRELSLVEFHQRVLDQAKDERIPLLERLRFLTISSSILDEFFEVRVAGVKQQLAFGITDSGPDKISPRDLDARISERCHRLVEEQYRVLKPGGRITFGLQIVSFLQLGGMALGTHAVPGLCPPGPVQPVCVARYVIRWKPVPRFLLDIPANSETLQSAVWKRDKILLQRICTKGVRDIE